ncbi:hypothetical protein MKX24_25225, partial [Klebsiella quasipneumoniae]
SVKTGNNARNGGKNSLNRLIRCVCGKKIGPDPRNFNQRVSLGRNDLLIRTFLNKCLLIDQNGVMDVYSAESLTPGHERNGRFSMPKWPPEGYCESSESAPTAAKNRPTNSYNEW